MSGCPRVAVVGAGAAGTLSALHLLRTAVATRTRLDVVLVDPAVRWARGAAFGTADPRHLLNVPARGMSALPEQPDDFVVWRQRMGLGGDGDTFAPRMEWSRYLADLVYTARRDASGTATMTHRRARALEVRRTEDGLVVGTDEGNQVAADAVVVATGLPSAGDHWAPAAVRASPRFVADPLEAGVLAEVRGNGGDALLVGTGLTMVDVVLTLSSSPAVGRLLAVSRSGALPAGHLARRLPPVLPDVSDWGSSLEHIRERAARHVAAVRAETGDWRPGVDGVRHRVAELWQRLDEADRATFVARDAGPWNLLRHRMPPSSTATLASLRGEGRLEIRAGEIADVAPAPRGALRVELTDGSVREVGWVVNCTGPRSDVRTLGNPLLEDLLRPRPDGVLATVSTGGMGFRTDRGRVVDGAGSTATPLWTLGALRRGELWESTAVPEIREQAVAVAADVVAAVTEVRGPSTARAVAAASVS
ncbi:FAD/NAD(P)-binding protein [Nocardioides sp. MH1]|uniref:FAD/NAD(P)-binding protein n=1 Tax=Nocardioides sp. MH1 TaxID=3242490 RepID=UPI003520A6F5